MGISTSWRTKTTKCNGFENINQCTTCRVRILLAYGKRLHDRIHSLKLVSESSCSISAVFFVFHRIANYNSGQCSQLSNVQQWNKMIFREIKLINYSKNVFYHCVYRLYCTHSDLIYIVIRTPYGRKKCITDVLKVELRLL